MKVMPASPTTGAAHRLLAILADQGPVHRACWSTIIVKMVLRSVQVAHYSSDPSGCMLVRRDFNKNFIQDVLS